MMSKYLLVCRIRLATDAIRRIGNVVANGKVTNRAVGLLEPPKYSQTITVSINHARERGERKKRVVLGEGVRPALAQTTRFLTLEATSGAAASHAARDTVCHLVDEDIILHGAVTTGLSCIQLTYDHRKKEEGMGVN